MSEGNARRAPYTLPIGSAMNQAPRHDLHGFPICFRSDDADYAAHGPQSSRPSRTLYRGRIRMGGHRDGDRALAIGRRFV